MVGVDIAAMVSLCAKIVSVWAVPSNFEGGRESQSATKFDFPSKNLMSFVWKPISTIWFLATGSLFMDVGDLKAPNIGR